MMAELKKVRRRLSARLLKARREGRELEELRAMGREAERKYREALRARPNGRARRTA